VCVTCITGKRGSPTSISSRNTAQVVLIVLQDGRQLEGERHSMSGRFEIGGVTFDQWEVEEREDVT
jgi:hypothetical protein